MPLHIFVPTESGESSPSGDSPPAPPSPSRSRQSPESLSHGESINGGHRYPSQRQNQLEWYRAADAAQRAINSRMDQIAMGYEPDSEGDVHPPMVPPPMVPAPESDIVSSITVEAGPIISGQPTGSVVAIPGTSQMSLTQMQRREVEVREAVRRAQRRNNTRSPGSTETQHFSRIVPVPRPIDSDESPDGIAGPRPQEFQEPAQRERRFVMQRMMERRRQREIELAQEINRVAQTNQLNRHIDTTVDHVSSVPERGPRYTPMVNPTEEIHRRRDDPPEDSPPQTLPLQSLLPRPYPYTETRFEEGVGLISHLSPQRTLSGSGLRPLGP